MSKDPDWDPTDSGPMTAAAKAVGVSGSLNLGTLVAIVFFGWTARGALEEIQRDVRSNTAAIQEMAKDVEKPDHDVAAHARIDELERTVSNVDRAVSDIRKLIETHINKRKHQ